MKLTPGNTALYVRRHTTHVVASAVALFSLLGVASETHGQESPIRIAAGHVVSEKGALLTSQLLQRINEQLPEIDVFYDEDIGESPGSSKRFTRNTRLADLICVYAGSTDALGEINQLVRDGRLQPIDALPDYDDLIQPDDIYANLLEPVTIDGHVWALPIRTVLPILMVDGTAPASIERWSDLLDLANESSFTPALDSDYYMMWLTLLSSQGAVVLSDGTYSVDSPVCGQVFRDIEPLFRRQRPGAFDEATVCLANSDLLTDFPSLLTRMKPTALPVPSEASIYCSSWTWYMAVSADVAGPARRAVVPVLAAILSPPVQMEIALSTYAPPVRPSIVHSEEFQLVIAQNPPLSVLTSMIDRLAFRTGGAGTREAEQVLEQAFGQALRSPARFQAIMHRATLDSNALLDSANARE